MAGHECSGGSFGRGDLFHGAMWVLCPPSDVDPDAMDRVLGMVRHLRAMPLLLGPEEHDLHAAVLSHLPHVFAATLLVQSETLSEPGIGAGSWRDLTRVGGSNPELWADILVANRAAMLSALESSGELLDSFRAAVEAEDRDALVALFERWTEIDLGVDRLLFPSQLDQFSFSFPGRVGINPATVFLVLGLARLGQCVQDLVAKEMRSLVAMVALGLASSAAIIILFSRAGTGPALPLLTTSLPAAIVSIALALAAITWNSGFGWMRDLARDPDNRRMLQILLPAALILPVLPAVLELVLARRMVFTAAPGQLLAMLGNVLIVGTIAYWAVTRVAREQSVQVELSEAIDVTTMALTSPDGRIVHWSEGAARLFGWSEEEARGQNKYLLLRSRCESAETTLPRRPQDETQELVETTRDGREIAILERVHRVEIAGRDPVIIHKMTDISDRARAVAELRESEERLAIATATHEVGVFEWDVATGRLAWAPGAEERLGLVPGTVTSFDSWRDQIEPEDAERVMETIEAAVADRAPRFSFRYRFK
ncbi:MAG: prephenate dehydrogenase/arogenate dehydrogenase family protein, partial [Proteobacteria bacterium]|nr:prephenate dehydrogenase/arogenate dehydrogenase family protein [Pseudomonadota bacterium]